MKVSCLAMILAGGQGSRLGVLTKDVAKPAVPFGGKYRIIDFPLSNCANSGINMVGVLTQYRPLELHSYLGTGGVWDLDRRDGGVFILPPYAREKGADWYKGTADAIYQNLNFIEMASPEYVLILSGDHIYTMDYSFMLQQHKDKKADVTIGVIEVPWEEASRFGIMNTDETGRITEFEEKPANPKSNFASMGIYIFSVDVLRKYLIADAADPSSEHDFGKNVIPQMLSAGCNLFSYEFQGYWKDVGTIESLWQANMDLLEEKPDLELNGDWRINSATRFMPPHYIGTEAKVSRSIIDEGSMIYGEVDHSVIFYDVDINDGARVKDAVVMPHSLICAGAKVDHAIIGQNVIITPGAEVIGRPGEIAVVGEGECVTWKMGAGINKEEKS